MALSANAAQRIKIALAQVGAGQELIDAIENPTLGEDLTFNDGVDAAFGTSVDALIRWSEADVSNPSFVIGLGDSNQGLHITDKGAVATDWNIAATTHPNVYIHSNTTPATDYIRIGGHDGTTADIDVVGGTTLRLMAAGALMTSITATAVTLADSQNIVVNATTGTKIGTATTQKLSFWNVTPVVQPAALTAAKPTFTIADAEGTPDDAIAAVTSSTPFGFSNAAELITILYKIQNMHTRLGEVEARLEASGLIAAN